MIEALFYRGPETLGGHLVRFWTVSQFSHCELHFGGGQCFSSRPGSGVSWTYRDIDRHDWLRIAIPGADGQESKIREWCGDEVGCAYDWRGVLFTQVLPWGWRSKDKWFCSEICTAALQRIGMLPGIKPWHVSPSEFLNLITEP